ncbi:MAG: rhamnulokinase family protein [Bacteroidales bacterium]
MPKHHFLAYDFGAEHGRAILGTLLESDQIELKEIHRFSTGQIPLQKHYYWNIFRFYEEIIKALHICVQEEKIIPQSIGISTWGVDFGLICRDGSILRTPYSYRDQMTETSMPAFLERMGRHEIYERTGIAIHKFNTVYQLYAMVMANDPVLSIAEKILFLPDLINYLLTGEAKSEFTMATTSQLFNPEKMDWDKDIVNKLGLKVDLFQEIVAPGTVIGVLNQNISRSIDVEGIKVIAVTSHDTAAAITAVPAEGDDWAYISSGTWSLMGLENKEVVFNHRSLLFNFTNEGGAEGKFHFQKNIMGLWIIKECRKSWFKNEGNLEYKDIERLAKMADSFTAMIDPDYAGFYNPLDMPAAINTFCRQTGQFSPQGIGTIARTIFESLALKYRMVLEQMEMISNKTFRVIHVVGEGSQNKLLCQFTANATGRKVVAGPAESTGTGVLLIQALAQGYLKDIAHIRRVVKNSFDIATFEPEDREVWNEAYSGFLKIAKQN